MNTSTFTEDNYYAVLTSFQKNRPWTRLQARLLTFKSRPRFRQ